MAIILFPAYVLLIFVVAIVFGSRPPGQAIMISVVTGAVTISAFFLGLFVISSADLMRDAPIFFSANISAGWPLFLITLLVASAGIGIRRLFGWLFGG